MNEPIKPVRLLKLTSGLGLCGRNDYELIQGNCSVKRQAKFYTRTLEMLVCKAEIPQDPSKTEDRVGIVFIGIAPSQSYYHNIMS